jgi:(R,R)-butanediol dehydrogenase/meso-butanediol dehydrogenase/diacetyl reductase
MNDTATMKAAVFEGEGKLSIKDVPCPSIRHDNEVLLQVEACGICGSDLHILEVPPGHPATPGVILGHEYIGRVLQAGSAVTTLRPGDPVAVAPNLNCGLCYYCRHGLPNQCENFRTLGVHLNGGLANHNVAPERACYKLDPALPVEEAVFVEPLSTILAGTERVKLQPGETAVVLGAGPIGLLYILNFKAAGAGKIIAAEVAPFRAEYARRSGADLVINPRENDLVEAVRGETRGIGADVVVDTVGSLFASAISLARKAGRVVLFGVNQLAHPAVSQYEITRNELTIYGAYVGVNTFPLAIQRLERGIVKPSALISHRLPLPELPRGIGLLRGGEAIKVVITP